MKEKLIKKKEGWYNLYQDSIGIASTHEELQGYKLSLKNCQAIERGYDLDELAGEFAKTKSSHPTFQNTHKRDFIEGFQKALELLGDKKFSSGQLLNAMDLVWQWMNGEDYECKTLTEVQDKHIQSLQQTEWDVEIEMENAFESYRDGTIEPLDIPKLDENGCLILKLKSE